MNGKLYSMPLILCLLNSSYIVNGQRNGFNGKTKGLPWSYTYLSPAQLLDILELATYPLPLSPPFTVFWVKGPLGALSLPSLQTSNIPPHPCIHTCHPPSPSSHAFTGNKKLKTFSVHLLFPGFSCWLPHKVGIWLSTPCWSLHPTSKTYQILLKETMLDHISPTHIV